MGKDKEIKIGSEETREQDDTGQKEEMNPRENHEERIEPEESFSSEVEQKEAAEDQEEEAVSELTEEEQLRTRVAELEDRLLRTMADFDNYKKRSIRQFDEMIASANQKLLVDLLDIVDNFERALAGENNQKNTEAYRKGMELIFVQIQDLLRRYDVRPIEAVGKPFDPEYHEALMQVESDQYEDGIVAVEMSKGYMQGNKVIRHSKVGVSKGGGEKTEQEE